MNTGGDRFLFCVMNTTHIPSNLPIESAERWKKWSGKAQGVPYGCPSSKEPEHIRQTSELHQQLAPTLSDIAV
jgi:hypothetical protein